MINFDTAVKALTAKDLITGGTVPYNELCSKAANTVSIFSYIN